MQIVKSVLESLSAVSALGAAAFWFCSAKVHLPPLGPVPGAKEWRPEVTTNEFYKAIHWVATLSKWAALCAGFSAGLQAVTIWFFPG